MNSLDTESRITPGGAFIIQESSASSIFISEELGEEQRMMQQAGLDFIEAEIEPIIDQIDSQEDLSLPPRLMEKAAALGFLSLTVPEAYGGMELDFKSQMAGTEVMSQAYSFMLTIGVQTSIGIAPILLYGNEKQKAKYLPKMITAELKSCYCLTEPGSGSDANSGKTRATPIEEGKYYLINGQKMWITNAGFADMFIVFAKIGEDAKLSAFIVEKAFGGITLGDEEKKMGIKGSSTRQVFFNDVKVPAENLLGARGQGFKIALNVLNTGRIKLGANCIGVGKKAMRFAVKYANERQQFGQAITNFGAIKHKIAEMAMRVYAIDSAIFRTAHNIDLTYERLCAEGMDKTKAKSKSVEEYAIECALLKVFGSEAQSYIVDQGLQIFGGMGFSEEAPMARLYRDTRINRIFEGTNEINRMLTVDMLLKKAMSGKINMMQPAMAVAKELAKPVAEAIPEGPLGAEKAVLGKLKKAFLAVTGAAVQQLMQRLESEQEILMNAADMLMYLYILESTLLKTEKLIQLRGEEACASQVDMLRIMMHESVEGISRAGKEAVYAFAEGDSARLLLDGLSRFTQVEPFNLKAARRRVADEVIAANGWCF